MPMGEQETGERTCPRCGSAAVTRHRVIEHEPCGAIKPEPAFCTAEGIVCPDCGDRCREVEFVGGARPLTCEDCGHTFSTSRQNATDGEAAWQGDATALLESVRSRIAATPSSSTRPRWGRWTLIAVVIAMLVAAAVIATVGPAAIRPERVATETGPASEATADGPGSAGPGPDVEQGTPGETTWTTYRSIVVFRADDVQAGYRMDAMRSVDRVFAAEGVPVTQGVIPPLENGSASRALCGYLSQRQRAHPETFEYALHGYAHERRTGFHGRSEFGGLPAERQKTLIREGTAALEACVQRTPTTFVPPFNTYDDATASALADDGYAAVSGGEWFTREYYDETGPFTANGIVHLPTTHSFVRNWTTNEFYAQDALERRFDEAYRDGELYVQMLHAPTFTSETKLARLRGLVDHMKSKDDVAFMSVGEFARKYDRGRLERTETGWRVAEPVGGGEPDPDAAPSSERAPRPDDGASRDDGNESATRRDRGAEFSLQTERRHSATDA